MVQSRAGHTWSGSSEAAPSEISGGCNGTRESAPYSVIPRLLRLEVDRVARRDERREVGDRVVDDVAVAVAHDVHRLVEVHRRRRVDRHEGQVGPVEVGHPRGGGRRLGGRHHVLGELGRDLELLLDARDAVAELVGCDSVVGCS